MSYFLIPSHKAYDKLAKAYRTMKSEYEKLTAEPEKLSKKISDLQNLSEEARLRMKHLSTMVSITEHRKQQLEQDFARLKNEFEMLKLKHVTAKSELVIASLAMNDVTSFEQVTKLQSAYIKMKSLFKRVNEAQKGIYASHIEFLNTLGEELITAEKLAVMKMYAVPQRLDKPTFVRFPEACENE